MAIHVIAKGDITCDQCGKEVAKISMPEEVFQIFIAAKKVTRVTCTACFYKIDPLPNI